MYDPRRGGEGKPNWTTPEWGRDKSHNPLGGILDNLCQYFFSKFLKLPRGRTKFDAAVGGGRTKLDRLYFWIPYILGAK